MQSQPRAATCKENGIEFADTTPRVTLFQPAAGLPVAGETQASETRAVAE
jgi:hypothetical protein